MDPIISVNDDFIRQEPSLLEQSGGEDFFLNALKMNSNRIGRFSKT